jgi:integrase
VRDLLEIEYLLKARGLVRRTLVVAPANLTFQWQRELKDKFRENFEVIRSDVLRATYGRNPWQERDQVITSISWVSRIEDAKESLLRSTWDLIIVDEAHKKRAAERQQEVRAMTRDQIKSMIAATDDRQYRTLFLLLGRTGLRIGEARALQWGDLDFNQRIINVDRAFSDGEIGTPKSGKTRKVDMSRETDQCPPAATGSAEDRDPETRVARRPSVDLLHRCRDALG